MTTEEMVAAIQKLQADQRNADSTLGAFVTLIGKHDVAIPALASDIRNFDGRAVQLATDVQALTARIDGMPSGDPAMGRILIRAKAYLDQYAPEHETGLFASPAKPAGA